MKYDGIKASTLTHDLKSTNSKFSMLLNKTSTPITQQSYITLGRTILKLTHNTAANDIRTNSFCKTIIRHRISGLYLTKKKKSLTCSYVKSKNCYVAVDFNNEASDTTSMMCSAQASQTKNSQLNHLMYYTLLYLEE